MKEICTIGFERTRFSSSGAMRPTTNDNYLTTSLPSVFVVVGRIAPDEEKLVFSKPVVQFSFTYGV